MKPAEAAALLAVAAAFDNRKPDADAATAWALALDGRRFEDCRDAIVAYYRKSREWVMPSDMLEGVSAIRNGRISAFWRASGHVYLLPPAHLADDPAGEQRWSAEMLRRIADGEVIDPDQIDDRGELKPRDVASLGLIGKEVPDQAHHHPAATRAAGTQRRPCPCGGNDRGGDRWLRP